MTGWGEGLFAIAFGLVQIVMYLIVFGEGGALFGALFFNVSLANPPEHSSRAEASLMTSSTGSRRQPKLKLPPFLFKDRGIPMAWYRVDF